MQREVIVQEEVNLTELYRKIGIIEGVAKVTLEQKV